jgi:hypothetical protein
MTPSQTVLTGTVIACATYLFKQILDFYIFSRLTEYGSIRGQAIERAVFITHFILRLGNNPKEEVISLWIDETQEIRRLAGTLMAFENKRHWLLWGVPPKSAVREATIALLGLSGCTSAADLEKAIKHTKTIRTAFGGGTYEVPLQ